VQEKIQNGYEIFYIGKNQHPEAESIYTLGKQVHLIEKKKISLPVWKVQFLSPTKQRCPFMKFPVYLTKFVPAILMLNFIMNFATPQELDSRLLLELDPEHVDTLIVVGDPSSNNTRKLESIGLKRGISIPTV